MSELQTEATGETVGEAKWQALRELERLQPGLDKSLVRFQVLSEGERGLLGVGYSPARVLASVAVDVTPVESTDIVGDESELAALVRELLERITDAMGLRARIDIHDDGDVVTASCSGGDLGILIGKRGQTIDAVQYLVNAIARRTLGDEVKLVVVDAARYRERRQATLETIAARAAERARRGDRVELEPMSAPERKIVHLHLQDEPGVTTESSGVEPYRYVVVAPAGD